MTVHRTETVSLDFFSKTHRLSTYFTDDRRRWTQHCST